MTKKRLKQFQERVALNNGTDRELIGWKLVDIHKIPKPFSDGNEVDFYCYKNDFYLLRIRKSENNKLFIAKNSGAKELMYLIAEINSEILSDKVIIEILNDFETLGIPKYQSDKIHIRLK